MGLLITAYLNTKLYNTSGMNEDQIESLTDTGNFVQVWKHTDYPERAPELVNDAVYYYTNKFNVSFETYIGYSNWLEKLATLMAYPADPNASDPNLAHSSAAQKTDHGPFWEMINFSHSEGVLGSQCITKLAKDFRDNYLVATLCSENDWWKNQYKELNLAFTLASEHNGFIKFQ